MERKPRFNSKPDSILKAIKDYMISLDEFQTESESMISFNQVVFRCGTVVYLGGDNKFFTGFDDSYKEEFPHHRTSNFESILEENEHDWKWSQTLKHKDDISKAYYKLINDGYPYPGGEGADRNVLPVGKDSILIFNLLKVHFVK